MNALYIGWMSGTSMDGVDAVLCEFEGTVLKNVAEVHSSGYPPDLRKRLLGLQRGETTLSLSEFAELDELTADVFAQVTNELLARSGLTPEQITALGSHGQTVFHDPLRARSSLQVGDPNRIAALTGIATVADFRRKDIALGGHGAPLVPAFHQAMFGVAHEVRCILNLGGIANITLLPGDGHPVRGFDTGPGNGLMDEWAQQHLGLAFDANGGFAAQGQLHEELLAALLADAYFRQAPPKSTGRGQFHLEWARQRYPAFGDLPPADVQRTLTELTARSVADAIKTHAPATQRLLVCGGGARNGWLMQRLRELTGLSPELTDAHGLPVQWVEAAAFAWLAMRRMNKLSGNLPAVTGASREAVLGGVFLP
jgi:anhydro-N-acetylmuramic acid kinase